MVPAEIRPQFADIANSLQFLLFFSIFFCFKKFPYVKGRGERPPEPFPDPLQLSPVSQIAAADI